jgi:uncharacterized repeat protein (TIGR03803 family)
MHQTNSQFALALAGAAFVGCASSLGSISANAAPQLTTIHSFIGSDGEKPRSRLLIALDRAVYGTASAGGAFGKGTVFKLKRDSFEILHSFGAGSQGAFPGSTLIMGSDGALYGTTFGGGPSGAGTVFKLIPPAPGHTRWRERTLYAFTGGSDGNEPENGVVMDADGVLYGVAPFGGAVVGTLGGGTVYSLTPPAPGHTRWRQRVLHSFTDGRDGRTPRDRLLLGPDGTLYGVTEYFTGTIFKLTPPLPGERRWKYGLLHGFNNADGSAPQAGLIRGPDGKLYGTTKYGGASGKGTVFSLTPPAPGQKRWKHRILYSFTGGNDGGFVQGGVFMGPDGALYGTTFGGGSSGAGTVFKLAPSPWRHDLLHTFIGKSGAVGGPVAEPVMGPNGLLYGTTLWGGTARMGTVYKLTQ